MVSTMFKWYVIVQKPRLGGYGGYALPVKSPEDFCFAFFHYVNNSASSTMAVIAVVFPPAVAPRTIALTMRILHFASIEHVHIARSIFATMDSAWRRCGAFRALKFALFTPQERQCAGPFDRLAGEAAFARRRR
jgi:hypothetical protein